MEILKMSREERDSKHEELMEKYHKCNELPWGESETRFDYYSRNGRRMLSIVTNRK